LENSFWNDRLIRGSDAYGGFNTEPNAFLVAMVDGRRPGAALDMGAGQGRNSIYLAQHGWKVTAVDPADQALEFGSRRAESLGFPFKTVVATDQQFDFGRNKWDLILYSWVSPQQSAERIVESLAPGGVLVVEGGQEWFGDNGLLKMFPKLRVLRYEDVTAPSDFFNRRQMQVARLCAEKTSP
jgi:SAM-dependent methyltransferase